jgi:hypothetical protein
MAQDPMGFAAGNPNLYGYVWNQPLDSTDDTGLSGIGDMMRSGMNMITGIGKDVQMMAMHPAATIAGYYEGLGDGAAMLANAATFQMTPLNNYVEGRIAMMGGGYAVANIAANVGVGIAYAILPCGWLATGVKVMGAASDAVTVGQGIAERDAAKIAMGLVGLGTLMVGRWCFVEGTHIHMAGDEDGMAGTTRAGGPRARERGFHAAGPWRQRALGFVCVAFGLGVYLAGRSTERRRLLRPNGSLVDAALEEWLSRSRREPDGDLKLKKRRLLVPLA